MYLFMTHQKINRICGIAGLSLLILFSSCLNKETAVPLPPHVPGDESVGTVNMENDYRYQIFYNLKNNAIVQTGKFTLWDLGFETSVAGWHIVLNGARVMKAYKTAKTDFTAVKMSDTAGVAGELDMPSGSLDSTAIGDWRSGNVYIINRGYDETGDAQGFVKVKILASDAAKYTIQFGDISGTNTFTIEVPKNDAYNLSHLSFDNGGKALFAEPPKKEWDIVFTKYVHIYYELDNTPYSVVGCMLNRYETLGALDTSHVAFKEIDITHALEVPLSAAVNSIGFDWKTYTGSTYKVDPTKCYVIRNAEGQYFKLHFIGFLDKSGIKGNPAWEYQRL